MSCKLSLTLREFRKELGVVVRSPHLHARSVQPDLKNQLDRTGRIMDTSPPIWELQSARERRYVYERELVLGEHFASRSSSRTSLAFTSVNGKASLGAPGVNMLIRKRFRKLS